jgi:aspartyl-tRNA(Asn)/glutamyl-tRNA(Gln) amidotransferase subunit B
MRSKEEAQDYRYFPDPDLPPLVIDETLVDEVKRTMPELPEAKRRRFVEDMKVSPYAAQVLTGHPRVAAFFEETATLHGHPMRVANFVQSEILADVQTHGLTATLPVAPAQVAALLKMADDGAISGKQAKEVYAKLAGTDRMPQEVVDELGMRQVTDVAVLEELCRQLIAKSPKQVEQLRAGKTNIFGYFVGQVMKETKGSANPQLVNDVLKKLLGAR